MRNTRPLDRHQQLQNQAFLRALRRCGNVRQAARATGISELTLRHRRRHHPAFATRWDAALAVAQARLASGVGLPREGDALRTAGGEAVVVRLASGRLQVRRAHPGLVTKAAEQGFLLALAATANITLAAAAVGVAPSVFHRRRDRDPGFAREMRAALAEGAARLREALIEGFLPGGHEDDGWRHNEPPAMPAMTPAQALQLLALNGRQAAFGGEAIARRRGKGEHRDVHGAAIARDYAMRMRRDAEDTVTAGLNALAATLGVSPHEAPAPVLPDLNQLRVSKADPASAGLEGRADGLMAYNARRRYGAA